MNIEQSNDETEEVNAFIRSITHTMTETAPFVPEPIILDRVEVVRFNNDTVVESKTIDLTQVTDKERDYHYIDVSSVC
jgi:hypothetical protein